MLATIEHITGDNFLFQQDSIIMSTYYTGALDVQHSSTAAARSSQLYFSRAAAPNSSELNATDYKI